MLLNCGVGEDSGESPGLWEDQTSQSLRKLVLNIHWKGEYWSSNTFATWCFKELTPWKRPWCWERLKAGGEGDNRGWDGWMASPTQWTWVWVNSRSWWWTVRPGVLQSMGWQKVGHGWTTARDQAHVSCIARWILNNWTTLKSHPLLIFVLNVGIGLHPCVLSVSAFALCSGWPTGPVLLLNYLVHDWTALIWQPCVRTIRFGFCAGNLLPFWKLTVTSWEMLSKRPLSCLDLLVCYR